MIEVMKDIYARLSADGALTSKLSTYKALPAIFMDWSQQVNGPYLVLTYLPTSEVYDTQVTQTLQVDIFERAGDSMGSYLSCISIRDDIVRILDRQTSLDGVENLRVYYETEQPVSDDDGRYRRYMVTFTMRWNRAADIQA